MKAIPMVWDQLLIARLAPTVVRKNNDSFVGFASDYPPRRLQHAVHPGVGIGIVVSALAGGFVVVAQNVPFIRERGQTDPDDRNPDQPAAGKVHPLGKRPAEHAESHAELPVVAKRAEERLARFGSHAARLNHGRHLRVFFRKGFPHLSM